MKPLRYTDVPMNSLTLPKPDASASKHSEQLVRVIQHQIEQQGPITFAEFMQQALYAPGLGYYSAGARKFGREGDFITAPEISPLFSKCIANQCLQVLEELEKGDILEFGAGSGVMAADILQELADKNALPKHYYILELSADLRERQRQLLQQRLPDFIKRVIWLDHLPSQFSGVMLANEVIDAMPVHRFKGLQEYYIDWQQDKLCWILAEPSHQTVKLAIKKLHLPPYYISEINLQVFGWLRSLSDCLQKGALLVLDYGFWRDEFYHPDRSMGTLMCHYCHRVHDDPFMLVGLQDITTHVDFTAIAEGGEKAGFKVAGYTNQAQFLLNCGIAEMAVAKMKDDRSRFEISQQIKLLTLPSEMGELFKVMGLVKEIDGDLIGFAQGNRDEEDNDN